MTRGYVTRAPRQLSERQREVADLVAHGLSNKEIATELGIVEETVKNHVSATFRFAAVENRTELTRWWLEQEAGQPEPAPVLGPQPAPIDWTLAAAVVVAQLLDLATWLAMPRAAEVNPIAQGLHTPTAWVLKGLLVLLVLGIQPALRPKYSAVGELVAIVAIAAGCVGAGSNLAVLAYVNAAEASRSAPEPALVVRATTGIEQGTAAPAAPERTPAPRRDGGGEAPGIPRGTSVGDPGEHCLDRRSLPSTELWPQDIDDAPGIIAARVPEVVRPTSFAVAAAGGAIDIWPADPAIPDRAVEPLKGVRDAHFIGVLLHLQPELVRRDPGAALAVEESRCPGDLDLHTPIVADHVPPRNAIGTQRGTASWYRAAGMIAAAGPGLRRALGRHWRGQVVRVVAGDRSVVVRLTDWCQCYKGDVGERLIDLSDDAFARLAPLPVGVIAVRISTIVPPATDAEVARP